MSLCHSCSSCTVHYWRRESLLLNANSWIYLLVVTSLVYGAFRSRNAEDLECKEECSAFEVCGVSFSPWRRWCDMPLNMEGGGVMRECDAWEGYEGMWRLITSWCLMNCVRTWRCDATLRRGTSILMVVISWCGVWIGSVCKGRGERGGVIISPSSTYVRRYIEFCVYSWLLIKLSFVPYLIQRTESLRRLLAHVHAFITPCCAPTACLALIFRVTTTKISTRSSPLLSPFSLPASSLCSRHDRRSPAMYSHFCWSSVPFPGEIFPTALSVLGSES